MGEEIDYTPFDTSKLTPKKKKSSFLSNKVFVGFIIFFTIGVGLVGYLLVLQKPIRREIPAQVEITPTEVATPSPTGEVTPTETPSPPAGELTPTPSPEAISTTEAILIPTEITEPRLSPTEILSPTLASTGTPTPSLIPTSSETPTPTEIILVMATAAPGAGEATTEPQVTEIPPAGIETFGKIFAVISFAVIFLGLIL